MDNQHRLIKGYRDLTKEDVDRMNRVKEMGRNLEELIASIAFDINEDVKKASEIELNRMRAAEVEKWLEEAKTNFQVGLMCLSRAVAQPLTF